jgi:putative ABC transport system permease protein
MLHTLRQDLTSALRALAHRPALTGTIIATLAVGIGGTTTVFGIADALLVRDLPYPGADRMLVVEETNRRFGGNVAAPNFEDLRPRATSLEAVAIWTIADVNLAGPNDLERVSGIAGSSELFGLIGAERILGRAFTEHEREPGSQAVALLSERAWRRLFGAAASAIGRSVVLDGVPHAVVGVVRAPGAFRDIDVFRPLIRTGNALIRRNHAFRSMARLKPGASIEAAAAEINLVYTQLEAAYPDTNKDWRIRLRPLKGEVTEGLSDPVLLVAAVSLVLLLIACANVATLLLVRARERSREFAVRASLGASRARLVRQSLTESAVLAIAGAAAGLLLAYFTIPGLFALLPDDTPLWTTPQVDPRVVAFAIAVAIVTAGVFGLLPALALSRSQPAGALRDGGTSTDSRSRRRARTSLTFAQVALASALLLGAGLLLSSLARVLQVDPGFSADGVVTFRVTPPRATYADAPSLSAYYDSLLNELRALPQVAAAGAVSGLPLVRGTTVRGVMRPGDPIPAPDDVRLAAYQIATPGYMSAMGMRLRQGREFTDADTAQSQAVTIVNRSLANALWPDGQALGRELLVHTDEKLPRLVVGVIDDVRHYSLEDDVPQQYFVPFAQAPIRTLSVALRVRSRLDPAELQRITRTIDPTLPLYGLSTIDQVLAGALASRRAMTTTLGAFALIAVGLAAIGLWTTVASGVAERRREIGIRIALGATQANVSRLFLRQGLTTAIAGVAAGLLASRWAMPLIEDWLFGITPLDVTTLVAVTTTLIAVSMAAAWLPARQSARVDPVRTLKGE